MKSFLLRCLVFALALMATSYLASSVNISGFKVAFMAALVFAFLNSVIKPILLVLSLPINILTLGLFTFVVNGLIFYLTSKLVYGFQVTGFAGAVWGSILFSIINVVITSALDLE